MKEKATVQPYKAEVMDALKDAQSMVRFMDYTTRLLLDASGRGEVPGESIVIGVAIFNELIEEKLQAIVECIEETAVFPECV